jgi:hypothetical protein
VEAFVKGDVVVAKFSFSDLTSSKKRPALVLASFSKNRLNIRVVLWCQPTEDATEPCGFVVRFLSFRERAK